MTTPRWRNRSKAAIDRPELPLFRMPSGTTGYFPDACSPRAIYLAGKSPCALVVLDDGKVKAPLRLGPCCQDSRDGAVMSNPGGGLGAYPGEYLEDALRILRQRPCKNGFMMGDPVAQQP